MVSQNNKVIEASNEIRRLFAYKLGGLDFNWNLRIDIKQDLKTAIEVAKRFIVDCEDQLKQIK